jgi:hypothetical protein
MIESLEDTCMKKKYLIKDILNHYSNSYYPLYIYQFIHNGKIKHISCRYNNIHCIDFNKDYIYKTTLDPSEYKGLIIPFENIRVPYSINDFVDDFVSVGPTVFPFPKIKSDIYDNINMYQLCLDYKFSRDMLHHIKLFS